MSSGHFATAFSQVFQVNSMKNLSSLVSFASSSSTPLSDDDQTMRDFIERQPQQVALLEVQAQESWVALKSKQWIIKIMLLQVLLLVLIIVIIQLKKVCTYCLCRDLHTYMKIWCKVRNHLNILFIFDRGGNKVHQWCWHSVRTSVGKWRKSSASWKSRHLCYACPKRHFYCCCS